MVFEGVYGVSGGDYGAGFFCGREKFSGEFCILKNFRSGRAGGEKFSLGSCGSRKIFDG
jgi:hypothetical protein